MMNGTGCGGCGGYCMDMMCASGCETIAFDLPGQISQMLRGGGCFTGCGYQHFEPDPCFVSACSCYNNNLEDKDKSVYAMSYEHPTKDYGNFPRNGLPNEQPAYAWPTLTVDLANGISRQSGNRHNQGTSKPAGYDTDSIFSAPQHEDSNRYQMASFDNNTGNCKPPCSEKPNCIPKPNCMSCPPTPCIPIPCMPNCNFRNYMLSGCKTGAICCGTKFYDERKQASDLNGETNTDANADHQKSRGRDGKDDGNIANNDEPEDSASCDAPRAYLMASDSNATDPEIASRNDDTDAGSIRRIKVVCDESMTESGHTEPARKGVIVRLNGSGLRGFNRSDPRDLHYSGPKDSNEPKKETKTKENYKDMVSHPHYLAPCRNNCAHPRRICNVPNSNLNRYYLPPHCSYFCCMHSYFRSAFYRNTCCPMPICCFCLRYSLYRGNELTPSAQLGALTALNMDPKLKRFYDIMHQSKDNVCHPTANMLDTAISTRNFRSSIQSASPKVDRHINGGTADDNSTIKQKDADIYSDIKSILNGAIDDMIEAQEKKKLIIVGNGTTVEPPPPPPIVNPSILQESQSILIKIESMSDHVPIINAAPDVGRPLELKSQPRGRSKDTPANRRMRKGTKATSPRENSQPRSDKRDSEASKPPKISTWEFIKRKCCMIKPPAKHAQSRSKERENGTNRTGNNRKDGDSKARRPAASTKENTQTKNISSVAGNVMKIESSRAWTPSGKSISTSKEKGSDLTPAKQFEEKESTKSVELNLCGSYKEHDDIKVVGSIPQRAPKTVSVTYVGMNQESSDLSVPKPVPRKKGIDRVANNASKARDNRGRTDPSKSPPANDEQQEPLLFTPNIVSPSTLKGQPRERPQSPKGRNARGRQARRNQFAASREIKVNTAFNKTISTIMGPSVRKEAREKAASFLQAENEIPTEPLKPKHNPKPGKQTPNITNQVSAESEPEQKKQRRSASEEIFNAHVSDTSGTKDVKSTVKYNDSSDSDDSPIVAMQKRKIRAGRASIAVESNVAPAFFVNIPDIHIEKLDEGKVNYEKYMGLKSTPKV